MSKRIISISLLVILLSACTYQVTVVPTLLTEQVQSTQAMESIPTVTEGPLIVVATHQPVPTLPFYCATISAPHVQIGQQVTVMVENSDKLKLREIPIISQDTVVMDLDQFTQLKILEGAVCVHSDETGTDYWFWKVSVLPRGEIGWVAEGDSQRYFIEPSTAATIINMVAPSICPNAPTPRVTLGQQVSVITENSDKLKLRELPVIAQNTEGMSLDQFTQLKILEGPVCFHADDTGYSYWFWKVEVLSVGAVGWVAEGDSVSYFIGPSQ